MAVVLNAEQLRILAEEIYNREMDAIRNIQFSTGRERAEYLRECRESFDATLALLESGMKLRHEFRRNNVKAPIAGEIFSYLEKAVNIALQSVRNYKIRMIYITKIKDHAGDMMKRLRTLDDANAAAASATAFKSFMEYHAMKQVTSAQNQNITRKLHGTGMTFQRLLNRYQGQNFPSHHGQFKSLSDDQKITVYARIIKASGRESPFENLTAQDQGHAGTVFLLFTLGIMVWDIFSSENSMEADVRNIIETAAPRGGALLRQALEVDAAGMVTDLAWCVVMAGAVTGVGGTVVLGTFVSEFVETFITSGGYPVIEPTKHRYYKAQTPDCVALAREVKRRNP